jgi:hypothetical protein
MFDDERRGCSVGRRGRRKRVRRDACTYSTTASPFLFLSLTLFFAHAIPVCLLHGCEAIIGVHACVLRLGRLGALIVQGAYIFRLGAPLCGNDLGHFRLGRFGLAEGGRGQILELV